MGYLIEIEKWAANLEEVTLKTWLKQEGDYVREGDLLCEIITDKATFEYEIESPGHIRRLFCSENSVLPVGYAIAFVGEKDEAAPDGVEERNQQLLREHQQEPELELDLSSLGETSADKPSGSGGRRVRATPAARRVARENNLQIEDVADWAQTDDVISHEDVEAYIQDIQEGQ